MWRYPCHQHQRRKQDYHPGCLESHLPYCMANCIWHPSYTMTCDETNFLSNHGHHLEVCQTLHHCCHHDHCGCLLKLWLCMAILQPHETCLEQEEWLLQWLFAIMDWWELDCLHLHIPLDQWLLLFLAVLVITVIVIIPWWPLLPSSKESKASSWKHSLFLSLISSFMRLCTGLSSSGGWASYRIKEQAPHPAMIFWGHLAEEHTQIWIFLLFNINHSLYHHIAVNVDVVVLRSIIVIDGYTPACAIMWDTHLGPCH